ncbi:methyl-CpG-binding domain-containing protein 5-like [Daucus carota subsp. sativus]|uniref:methyl-CpG-binding domain-containing protein 5-like n=1 Tax=Daucus carota subsp. sativus TaxID=79200 RepID=UPI0007EFC37D|nr:PREDICTED: methyl-CpG-binding domain-containing protein 5-like [Daucus carota subsp. sativus]
MLHFYRRQDGPELKATLIKQKIVKALKLCQRKQERKMWSNDQVGCLRIGQLLARLRLPVLLSGCSGAGATDRYYVEPTTGARFRSKVEVERYLETGSKNKLPSDTNATPSGTLNKNNEKSGTKKTGTKRKKEAVWSFDFKNPPEEVTWSLVDGMWKPSIGGEQVQESTAQEWAATFELECKME